MRGMLHSADGRGKDTMRYVNGIDVGRILFMLAALIIFAVGKIDVLIFFLLLLSAYTLLIWRRK